MCQIIFLSIIFFIIFEPKYLKGSYFTKIYKALLYSCQLKTGNFHNFEYRNKLCPCFAWALFICTQGYTSTSMTISEVPRFFFISQFKT
ncbi:hypothetical protein FLBR109950_07000 [Flavobacterium branchiophilum]